MKLRAFILAGFFAIISIAPEHAAAQSKNSPNTLQLDESATSPPAKISELAWLSGYWRGEGLGGSCEEIWSHPVGHSMFGTFSLLKDGKVVFSEATTIVEEGNSLVLKVKHFTPEFIGWEEKDVSAEFPLVRLGNKEAYFSGLTMRQAADNALSIFLTISKQGVKEEHEFRFRRVSF